MDRDRAESSRPEKGKQRRRKPVSCDPCRVRRTRCDRSKPCAACTARGEERFCTWDSNAVAPLYERREANETERLRSEGQEPSRQSLLDVDAASPVSAEATGASAPLDSGPSFPRAPSLSLQELVGRVPPLTRAQYVYHRDLVFAAKDADKSPPAISLALVLALCAHGLFSNVPSTTAYSSYSKDGLAARLPSLAMNALALSNHIERPTLDSIRALVLLIAYYVVGAPGDEGFQGVALLSIAASSCLQLELHRDPDDRPNSLTLAEKEDRRRLFHTTFVVESLAAAMLGQNFTHLRARTSTTRLPLDHDEQLDEKPKPTGEQTHMSALLVWMRFAQLTQRITEEVFGPHPVAYSRILEIDAQLLQFQAEADKPVSEPKQGGVATRSAMDVGNPTMRVLHERLRLHRAYLSLSYVDEKYRFSRQACLDSARQILELHDSPLLQGSWPFITYGSIVSAVVLCINILVSPSADDAGKDKAFVFSAVERLERFGAVSTICRRGSTLLRFLLAKIEAVGRSYRPSEHGAPYSKRRRGLSIPHASIDIPPEPELTHKPAHDTSLSSFPSSTSAVFSSSFPPSVSSRTGSPDAYTGTYPRPIRPPPHTHDDHAVGGLSHPTADLSSLVASTTPSAPPYYAHFPLSSFNPPLPDATVSAADAIASFDFAALFGADEMALFGSIMGR
ncbi:hypothetical protein JCM6882_009324 [Rhodosporidiobolus microsporus]